MNRLSGIGRLGIGCCLVLITCGAWGDDAPAEEPAEAQAPRIALIIDDLGNVLGNGARVVALDGPVACAVLPHTPHAANIARQAHGAGKEVLLHLPLQPVRDFETSLAGAIQVDTTRSQLVRIFAIDLASVPHAVGVNNHQGSLLTQHPGHMDWLMDELKDRGNLFFVDSFTSDASVALRLAHEHGVPAIRRDVFLDNTPTRDAIDVEFRRLKQLARSRGVAVGIGHPYEATLDYLERAIPELRAEGFVLVSVVDAIELDPQAAVRTASLSRQSVGH